MSLKNQDIIKEVLQFFILFFKPKQKRSSELLCELPSYKALGNNRFQAQELPCYVLLNIKWAYKTLQTALNTENNLKSLLDSKSIHLLCTLSHLLVAYIWTCIEHNSRSDTESSLSWCFQSEKTVHKAQSVPQACSSGLQSASCSPGFFLAQLYRTAASCYPTTLSVLCFCSLLSSLKLPSVITHLLQPEATLMLIVSHIQCRNGHGQRFCRVSSSNLRMLVPWGILHVLFKSTYN